MRFRYWNVPLCKLTLLLISLNILACRPVSKPLTNATESIGFDDLREPSWVSSLPPSLSFAGPHKNGYQETFMNPIANQALQKNNFSPWPEGTEFIKRTTTANGEIIGYSAQYKKNNVWEWATFDKDGKLIWKAQDSKDAMNSCNQCHQKLASKFDGVFTPVFFGKGSLSIPMRQTE